MSWPDPFDYTWLTYQPIENGRKYAIHEKCGWAGGKHVREIFEQLDAMERYA